MTARRVFSRIATCACAVWAWTARERECAHPVDVLVRRGGGLAAIAALSFIAGWLVPDPATLRDYLADASDPCFRIAWVVRVKTGEPEEPGPILLVQTAWTRDVPESGSADQDPCRASRVLLQLPPLEHSVYARQGGLLVPRLAPGDRPVPRITLPTELSQQPRTRSAPQGRS